MQLFHILQWTIQNKNVHIVVLKGALWDKEPVPCGICEIGLFHEYREPHISIIIQWISFNSLPWNWLEKTLSQNGSHQE